MDVAEDMQPRLDTPLHGVEKLHAAHTLHLLGDPVQEACAGETMGGQALRTPAPRMPSGSHCSLGGTEVPDSRGQPRSTLSPALPCLGRQGGTRLGPGRLPPPCGPRRRPHL